jgi:hypothetical protein
MQPSLCLMFDEPAVITLGGVIDAGGINHVPTRTFVNRTRHAWAEGRPPYGTYFLTNRIANLSSGAPFISKNGCSRGSDGARR